MIRPHTWPVDTTKPLPPVTRCDEFERRTFRNKRGGGMMPGHLDPRRMVP
jgi:hypothetical protein